MKSFKEVSDILLKLLKREFPETNFQSLAIENKVHQLAYVIVQERNFKK